MNYIELSSRLKSGTIIGKGSRAYRVETLNEENVYLRGDPASRRQDSAPEKGSLRIIPTKVVLDVIIAVQQEQLEIDEIVRNRRKGGSQSSSIFNKLSLDYDPFILGYDSTIRSICEHVLGSAVVPERNSEDNTGFLPKPFILLAGISGTGKTRWVVEQEETGFGNVKVIPVRPDWHEPSDLLGYVSRISGAAVFVPTDFITFLVDAWRHSWSIQADLKVDSGSVGSMVPFWLCLDEMNLAPVEQYFADYLSVLERRCWARGKYECEPLLRLNGDSEAVRIALGMASEDPLWRAFSERGGIPLPPNLVVVGTVNMDETTHAFSRKVLDRALTVEFDEVDFSRFREPDSEGHDNGHLPWTRLSTVTDALELDIPPDRAAATLNLLQAWNRILDQTAFRIAYRTINESLLIDASLADRPVAEALDWIVMAKLLPRLEGDEDRLGCDREGESGSFLDSLYDDWAMRLGESWEGSRARRKLDFMRLRLKRSGYCSFWP